MLRQQPHHWVWGSDDAVPETFWKRHLTDLALLAWLYQCRRKLRNYQEPLVEPLLLGHFLRSISISLKFLAHCIALSSRPPRHPKAHMISEDFEASKSRLHFELYVLEPKIIKNWSLCACCAKSSEAGQRHPAQRKFESTDSNGEDAPLINHY